MNANPNPPPADLLAHTLATDLNLETVVNTVASFYRIPPALAWGARRDRKAAWPRQVAMTLCCEFFPHLPCTTISRAFRRTHSTLVYARRCVLTAQKHSQTRSDLTRLRKLIHLKLNSEQVPKPSS